VATAVSRFGRLDILVNNAGVGGAGRLEDTRAEEWDRVMDINARGVFLGTKAVFLGTKAVIPAMRQAGGGSIINISSQLWSGWTTAAPSTRRPRAPCGS
jgi:NAD(P)-dependent dehydrogenase (short-subunit alcohol dehydrogenase family)